MAGADYIRIVVERYWLEEGSTVEQDMARVASVPLRPSALTGYTDRDMAEMVWAMIVRSAFESDGEEDT